MTKQQLTAGCRIQRKVIAALRATPERQLADRLKRCMAGRLSGAGRARACLSPGCFWCRSQMIQSWWHGICGWAAPDTSSLTIITLRSPTGLKDAVQRLRRGLRDVRDRTARHSSPWRSVCFAGMAGGNGTALILVQHEGVDRHEVLTVLRRRWPTVILKDLERETPLSTMMVDDAVDLARSRRGVEPLRVIVLPQRDKQPAASPGR